MTRTTRSLRVKDSFVPKPRYKQELVLRLVRQHPRRTAKELQELSGLDIDIGTRLNELAQMGLVRRCGVKQVTLPKQLFLPQGRKQKVYMWEAT